MHWSLEFATFRRRKLAPGKSYTQTLSFHFDGLSLALIGNDAAREGRGAAVLVVAESFSIRRLEGSRRRLRRTLAMGNECRF